MSRFFATGSESESESSSSEEEPVPQKAQGITAAFTFSDEEEETKRIVRSAREKRYEELIEIIKLIRNHKKIKDMSKLLTSFENLAKAFIKARPVIEKEERGVTPKFYVRCLVELEDFITGCWEDRDGRKNMSKNNSKSLGALRQKLRKYNKDFEGDIATYRENPEAEDEEKDEEEEEPVSEEDEKPTEFLKKPPKIEKEEPKSKLLKGSDDEDSEDDSVDWGSTSDGESSLSSDDEKYGGNLAIKFLKKAGDKDEQKESTKREKKRDKEHKEKKKDEDDEGWEEVRGGAVIVMEKPKMFAKDAEINHPVVVKKFNEILAARGKKGTDRSEQIELLVELLNISEAHTLGEGVRLKIIFAIVSAIFDYNPNISTCMKADMWQKCLDYIVLLLDTILEHPNITVGEHISEESENVTTVPYRVKGCCLTVVERMDEEFTKMLQGCDAHSPEYVERLKDEKMVCGIIERLRTYLENGGTPSELCRIYLRRIEHLYYKFDAHVFKPMEETAEENGDVEEEKTENVAEEKNDVVEEEKNENVEKEKTENVEKEKTENVEKEKTENVAEEKNENVAEEKNENVAEEKNENVAEEKNENVAEEKNENVEVEKNENVEGKTNEEGKEEKKADVVEEMSTVNVENDVGDNEASVKIVRFKEEDVVEIYYPQEVEEAADDGGKECENEEEVTAEDGGKECENEEVTAEVPKQVEEKPESTRELVAKLCKFIYAKDTTDRIRTQAMLFHIYHHALHDNWFEARDLMLMSHLQDNIHHSDVSTQILYNRALVQLGLCAFRHGNIKDAHNALLDIQSGGRAKELLAQGLLPQRQHERTPEQEKIEKRRQVPFHKHINLELLECVYLVSAMLLEIPYMAAHELEGRKRMISKSFHHQLRNNERQALVGPPESMREHVVAASKAMRIGSWRACKNFIINDKMNSKVWDLFHQAEKVRGMICRKIQEESLRTYLFTYSSVYDSLSVCTLSQMFELEKTVVHSIISKMIISEELMASLDEPTEAVIMHRTEPSRIQALSLQLSDKVSALVDQNERLWELKQGSYFGRTMGQQGGYRESSYQKGGYGQQDRGWGQQGGYKDNYQKGNYGQDRSWGQQGGYKDSYQKGNYGQDRSWGRRTGQRNY